MILPGIVEKMKQTTYFKTGFLCILTNKALKRVHSYLQGQCKMYAFVGETLPVFCIEQYFCQWHHWQIILYFGTNKAKLRLRGAEGDRCLSIP